MSDKEIAAALAEQGITITLPYVASTKSRVKKLARRWQPKPLHRWKSLPIR